MGIVSTNVAFVKVNSNGSGGANGADLPTRLKTISANGGNKFVTLTLGYENMDLVTGVQVNYKMGSYPTSPTDGQSMTVSGAATSIKVMGLTNKLTYYFRVFLYREVDGVIYYQTDVTNSRVTCMPRAVEITGANPKYSGTNYVAFTASASSFKLTAPAGTKITIGGGGQNGHNSGTAVKIDGFTSYTGAPGGSGGMIYTFTLPTDIVDETCSLTIGNKVAYNSSTSNLSVTTLKIGNNTYTSSSGAIQSIYTPIGYIGGKGGASGAVSYKYSIPTEAEDGEGAGGGGGASPANNYPNNHKGGSSKGYSGGGGGGSYGVNMKKGEPGSGYQNGTPATWEYCGVSDNDDGTYNVTFYFTGGDGGDGMSGAGGKGRKTTHFVTCDNYTTAYNMTEPPVDIGGSAPGGGGGAGYCGGGGGSYNATPGSGGGGICLIEWNA